MVFIVLTSIVLSASIYVCSGIKTTIIKEIILYSSFSLSTAVVMILMTSKSSGILNSFYYLGISLLGIIFHYLIMKKIDITTEKIDIYIYIYTLFQGYVFLFIGYIFLFMRLMGLYIVLSALFCIIFYLINVYCFYRFRRDKLLKVIIMPTLVSMLTFFSFGLVIMFLLAGSV